MCVQCCPTPHCLSHSILSLSEIPLGRDLDGSGGIDTRGTVALAIGSVYWAVQNREWFDSWAQGPGNWSEPLVVHVVVNTTGAAGLTTAPAAELVSCNRPSASPQLSSSVGQQHPWPYGQLSPCPLSLGLFPHLLTYRETCITTTYHYCSAAI